MTSDEKTKEELEIELFNEADYYDSNWEPYDVTCAGCGKVLPCDEACLEEGDRWECPECWEKFNAQERAAAEQRRKVDPKFDAFMESLGPSPWDKP